MVQETKKSKIIYARRSLGIATVKMLNNFFLSLPHCPPPFYDLILYRPEQRSGAGVNLEIVQFFPKNHLKLVLKNSLALVVSSMAQNIF
jgi:hypothetical protein